MDNMLFWEYTQINRCLVLDKYVTFMKAQYKLNNTSIPYEIWLLSA